MTDERQESLKPLQLDQMLLDQIVTGSRKGSNYIVGSMVSIGGMGTTTTVLHWHGSIKWIVQSRCWKNYSRKLMGKRQISGGIDGGFFCSPSLSYLVIEMVRSGGLAIILCIAEIRLLSKSGSKTI